MSSAGGILDTSLGVIDRWMPVMYADTDQTDVVYRRHLDYIPGFHRLVHVE